MKLFLWLCVSWIFLGCGADRSFIAGDVEQSCCFQEYELDELSDERYAGVDANAWVSTIDETVSTFGVDADGASLANVRRMIVAGETPPRAAVRIEEWLNYFAYDYPMANTGAVAMNSSLMECPWEAGHAILRIGLQGAELPDVASHWVFLIDTSGSMQAGNKLPLIQESITLLLDNMRSNDKISLVTYAGSTTVVISGATAADKSAVEAAIKELTAAGSTAGASGIELAYEQAQLHAIDGGNNRIILATDGDFNVGVQSSEGLVELIKDQRNQGVQLTVVGVGEGNFNDDMLEKVSNAGDGTYEYLDSAAEARKVFVDDIGEFYAVAEDVKVQVAFNAASVARYRLIGYANRRLNNEDFRDNSKDGGEIGAEQSITALYQVDFVTDVVNSSATMAATATVRYVATVDQAFYEAEVSQSTAVLNNDQRTEADRWSVGIAEIGLALRQSPYAPTASMEDAINMLDREWNYDPSSARSSYVAMMQSYMELTP